MIDEFSLIGVIKEFKLPLDDYDKTKGYMLIEYSDPANCDIGAKRFNGIKYAENYIKATVIESDAPESVINQEAFAQRSEYKENETQVLNLNS